MRPETSKGIATDNDSNESHSDSDHKNSTDAEKSANESTEYSGTDDSDSSGTNSSHKISDKSDSEVSSSTETHQENTLSLPGNHNKQSRQCLTAYFNIMKMLKQNSNVSLKQKYRLLLKQNATNLASSLNKENPITYRNHVIAIKGGHLVMTHKSKSDKTCQITIERFLACISLPEKVLFTFVKSCGNDENVSFSFIEKRAIRLFVNYMNMDITSVPFQKVQDICL